MAVQSHSHSEVEMHAEIKRTQEPRGMFWGRTVHCVRVDITFTQAEAETIKRGNLREHAFTLCPRDAAHPAFTYKWINGVPHEIMTIGLLRTNGYVEACFSSINTADTWAEQLRDDIRTLKNVIDRGTTRHDVETFDL